MPKIDAAGMVTWDRGVYKCPSITIILTWESLLEEKSTDVILLGHQFFVSCISSSSGLENSSFTAAEPCSRQCVQYWIILQVIN